MKCYIVCDNDSTQLVVIGTQEQAEDRLKELADACCARCQRDYGPVHGLEEFYRHYWHIHDCNYVLYTPDGSPVSLQLLDGEDDSLLIERIRHHQHG